MADFIFLFPGQGSQSVGMGKDLCENFSEVKAVFEKADEALGFSISELCFNGPLEEMTLTHNAQPAVTAVNLAVMEVLKAKGVKPIAVAGHSLGEYSADCAAGVFDIETALKLTRERGELMQGCADKNPGSMAAVIGLDMDKVDDICKTVTESGEGFVGIANFNSPSQVVITGESAAVEKACSLLSDEGAKRVIPLNVSGPWHSPLLEEAKGEFASILSDIDMKDPEIPLYANVDAQAKKSGAEVEQALVSQITGSVRWTQLIRAMLEKYPDAVFVECGPGKVLKGLLRQIDKGATCYGVECVKSLEKFLSKV